MGEGSKRVVCARKLSSHPRLCVRARRLKVSPRRVIIKKTRFVIIPPFIWANLKITSKNWSKLPDTVERVMVIGHNPGLEGLMQILSHQIEALPTATVANLSVPIEHWTELTHQTECKLNGIWHPKDQDAA